MSGIPIIIGDHFSVSLDYLVSGKKADDEWSNLTEGLSEEQLISLSRTFTKNLEKLVKQEEE